MVINILIFVAADLSECFKDYLIDKEQVPILIFVFGCVL